MGYNFLVTRVAVAESVDAGFVDIDVTVRQIGVAPFYYPLNLHLQCDQMETPQIRSGVEKLIEDMDTGIFRFNRIPATSLCLQNVQLFLDSHYAYSARPIRFAQGIDGTIALQIPLPMGTVAAEDIVDETSGIVDGFSIVAVDGRDYEVLRTLSNGDVIDMSEIDGLWSVQADVNDPTLADSATFRYGSRSHRVSRLPYVLEGDVQGHSNPSDYLRTAGKKTIAITFFNYQKEVTGIGKVQFELTGSAPQLPPSSFITSDVPHGFNTVATPTIPELEDASMSIRHTGKRKAGRIVGIVFGTLISVLVVAVAGLYVRRAYQLKLWCFAPRLPVDGKGDSASVEKEEIFEDYSTAVGSEIERVNCCPPTP